MKNGSAKTGPNNSKGINFFANKFPVQHAASFHELKMMIFLPIPLICKGNVEVTSEKFILNYFLRTYSLPQQFCLLGAIVHPLSVHCAPIPNSLCPCCRSLPSLIACLLSQPVCAQPTRVYIPSFSFPL
jgi:hypothetical protein